ncbi:porphobilinogen deaminase [Propionigenium maris DSM 9537]|uniref:Porphobilinogen deaminase n=1 Tax=Propionigenium maris DSM 9537 TaxID=1123000 RepID=A0A9W6GJ26_9FUSO|nr:hydroxymethylbilane synthase [Propionigenium maris]GLI54885.1 porphobilinogen deaminase [Propionigenium maris DSM 9537]
MLKKIVIGTRASILALAQTKLVAGMIRERFPHIEVEWKEIITKGDKDLRTNWNNSNTSLKSLFTKEIEKELLDGTIHIAVHSMKDMPAVSPEGLICGAIPEREDNRDVLITRDGRKLAELPEGAVIGTSSLRRTMSIKELRSDITIKPIRGNIHTRLGKLDSGEFDGILLALAGLKRTGMEDRATEIFEIDDFVPAPAQGSLHIQCREDNTEIREILDTLNDEKSRLVVEAEREFSRIFDGGCHTPMGCAGKLVGDKLNLKGMYYYEGKVYRDEIEGSVEDRIKLAGELAEKIRGQYNG